jgi:hypothetical protein
MSSTLFPTGEAAIIQFLVTECGLVPDERLRDGKTPCKWHAARAWI